MPRQYSPEFRQRALRLLDTMMETSDISSSRPSSRWPANSASRRSRCAGGAARLRSMPVSDPVRQALNMPRFVSFSVKCPNYAGPTDFEVCVCVFAAELDRPVTK